MRGSGVFKASIAAMLLVGFLLLTASSVEQPYKSAFHAAHKKHKSEYKSFVHGALRDGPALALYADTPSEWQKAEIVLVANDEMGLQELTIADEMHELSVSLPLLDSQKFYEDRIVPSQLFGPFFRKKCDCTLMEISAIAINKKGMVMRAAITISMNR